MKRLGDLKGFVGRRYGRFRVRDIRGRNVMVNELHDVHVQSIVEITDEGERGGEMRGVGCRGGRVSKTKIVWFIHALLWIKR